MICRSLRGAAGIFSLIMLFLPFAIQDISSLGRGFGGLPVFFVRLLFSLSMNPCGSESCFAFRPGACIIRTDPRLHLFQYLLTGFQGYRVRSLLRLKITVPPGTSLARLLVLHVFGTALIISTL